MNSSLLYPYWCNMNMLITTLWSCSSEKWRSVLLFSAGVRSVALGARRGLGVSPPGRGESGAQSPSGPESDRGQQPGGRRRGRAGLPQRGNCRGAAGVLVPPLRRRPHRYNKEQSSGIRNAECCITGNLGLCNTTMWHKITHFSQVDNNRITFLSTFLHPRIYIWITRFTNQEHSRVEEVIMCRRLKKFK